MNGSTSRSCVDASTVSSHFYDLLQKGNFITSFIQSICNVCFRVRFQSHEMQIDNSWFTNHHITTFLELVRIQKFMRIFARCRALFLLLLTLLFFRNRICLPKCRLIGSSLVRNSESGFSNTLWL